MAPEVKVLNSIVLGLITAPRGTGGFLTESVRAFAGGKIRGAHGPLYGPLARSLRSDAFNAYPFYEIVLVGVDKPGPGAAGKYFQATGFPGGAILGRYKDTDMPTEAGTDAVYTHVDTEPILAYGQFCYEWAKKAGLTPGQTRWFKRTTRWRSE